MKIANVEMVRPVGLLTLPGRAFCRPGICNQIVGMINPFFQFLYRNGTVNDDGVPMLLIHMVAGQDA
jgi:hypothetical protein